MSLKKWSCYNPGGEHRVLVTKMLPGSEWLEILIQSNCRVEVCEDTKILTKDDLAEAINNDCFAVIGQLTEKWDASLFEKLAKAGGRGYCNYAVGFNNVDVNAATRQGIRVGNTPGVLTEATAEMAMALTLACARRLVAADRFTRLKKFKGWLPDLFLGNRLWRGTLGIIGAGRIGAAYAMMMAGAFQMNILYTGNRRNNILENLVENYNIFLQQSYGYSININKAGIEEVLKAADVVSLHIPLTTGTHHLIKAEQLDLMKADAILINTSRGPVIDEAALAQHCKAHKDFSAGLDVFEFEPAIYDELINLENVTMAPHIASATRWTRESMAKIAALNIKGIISDYPLWEQEDVEAFLGEEVPKAIPSIINKINV